MATYMQGALKSGSTPSEYTNFGYATFTQTTTVTTTADGLAASATITIPAGSQIIDYYVDGTVAAVVGGGGTATTIPVTVGTAAAGAQYMTSTDMIAGGRSTAAKTVAQCLAMADVGTNTSVVITADPNGTIVTTQGVFRLTVVYAPKS